MSHFSPLPMHAIISSRRLVHRHIIPAPTCPCSHPERLFKQGVLGSGQKNYKVNTPAPLGISRCGGFCTFDRRGAASSLKWVSMKVSHAYKTCCICTAPRCDTEHCITVRRCSRFAKKDVSDVSPMHQIGSGRLYPLSDHESRGSDELSPPHKYSQFPSFSATCAGKISKQTIHVVLLIQRHVRHRFATLLFLTDTERRQRMLTSIDHRVMMHALCKMTRQSRISLEKKRQ